MSAKQVEYGLQANLYSARYLGEPVTPGTYTVSIEDPSITPESHVAASITELEDDGTGMPKCGAAQWEILSVSPQQGQTMIRFRLVWGFHTPHPLPYAISYIAARMLGD